MIARFIYRAAMFACSFTAWSLCIALFTDIADVAAIADEEVLSNYNGNSRN